MAAKPGKQKTISSMLLAEGSRSNAARISVPRSARTLGRGQRPFATPSLAKPNEATPSLHREASSRANQSPINAVGPSNDLTSRSKGGADANVSPHAIDQTRTIAVNAVTSSRVSRSFMIQAGNFVIVGSVA
jgi:hypothetical protein